MTLSPFFRARYDWNKLGEVTITHESPFSAIYVTALEHDKTIATSK